MVEGKKKKKSVKVSTESPVIGCSHANKSVKYEVVCNSFRHMKLGYCKDCHTSNNGDSEIAISTNICLLCGSQFCSSTSSHHHALKHYKDIPNHSICINTTTWVVWCFDCNTSVQDTEKYATLEKTINFLKRKIATEKTPKSDIDVNLHVKNVQSVPKAEASVKGLKNLGNTCFFNSVVQNIARLDKLYQKMESSISKKFITLKVETKPIDVEIKECPGSLTSSLHNLLNEMNTSSSKIINPSKLLSEVSKKAPQFRGYQQHDSHELLRYLLDSIRTEEIKRLETSLIEALSPSSNTCNINETIKLYLKSTKTHIDELFGGVFVSMICCQQCKEKSKVFEDFLDLSLPVSTEFDVPKKDKKKPNETAKDVKPLSKHQQKMKAKATRKNTRNKKRSQSKSESNDENKDSMLESKKTEDSENISSDYTNLEFQELSNETGSPLIDDIESGKTTKITDNHIATETTELTDNHNATEITELIDNHNATETTNIIDNHIAIETTELIDNHNATEITELIDNHNATEATNIIDNHNATETTEIICNSCTNTAVMKSSELSYASSTYTDSTNRENLNVVDENCTHASHSIQTLEHTGDSCNNNILENTKHENDNCDNNEKSAEYRSDSLINNDMETVKHTDDLFTKLLKTQHTEGISSIIFMETTLDSCSNNVAGTNDNIGDSFNDKKTFIDSCASSSCSNTVKSIELLGDCCAENIEKTTELVDQSCNDDMVKSLCLSCYSHSKNTENDSFKSGLQVNNLVKADLKSEILEDSFHHINTCLSEEVEKNDSQFKNLTINDQRCCNCHNAVKND